MKLITDSATIDLDELDEGYKPSLVIKKIEFSN